MRKARVFISCGQRDNERTVAQKLKQWFDSEGYEPYVAISVQTIMDLNKGIIGALKDCDYYLFINFRRELCKECNSAMEKYRGSLYTHQELAAAYVLDFEDMILISQEDVDVEGIQKFIVSNTPQFHSTDEVLRIVKNAVTEANWSPTFSRQLTANRTDWSENVNYSDHFTKIHGGARNSNILVGEIKNNRPDIAARHVICRLKTVTPGAVTKWDQSMLKATGLIGYEQTIWPKSTGSFDLLSVSRMNPTQVFLHSNCDIHDRPPLTENAGEYILDYEVLAENFPMLEFQIKLNLTGDITTTTVELIEKEFP
jgi:hypothetical protein